MCLSIEKLKFKKKLMIIKCRNLLEKFQFLMIYSAPLKLINLFLLTFMCISILMKCYLKN